MYSFNDHSTTPNCEYCEALDHAVERILSIDVNTCCEIFDNDTGELLFQYKNGNVTYIAGGFAYSLIIRGTRNHR